jgi:hypothetical protein
VYANHIPSLADSAESLAHGAFSAVLTDAAGQFQYRYVIWDPVNGMPWIMAAQDPTTGAVRYFTGIVRAPGEQVVLDGQPQG